MMNLGTVLKMLGVEISPTVLGQIEALIPQIPAKANELIAANMAAIKQFDDRLRAIEATQQQLLGQQDFITRSLRDGGRTERDGHRGEDPSGGYISGNYFAGRKS